MRALLSCLWLACAAPPAAAEIVVAVRIIRASEIIAAADLAIRDAEAPGALADPAGAIGQEARVALYPGRPIRPGDIGPPAIVERNDPVTLVFRQGGLSIATEGRALGRGAPGDTIRALNQASRVTVTGRIRADGSVEVQ